MNEAYQTLDSSHPRSNPVYLHLRSLKEKQHDLQRKKSSFVLILIQLCPETQPLNYPFFF